jgi:hypothetical protein
MASVRFGYVPLHFGTKLDPLTQLADAKAQPTSVSLATDSFTVGAEICCDI